MNGNVLKRLAFSGATVSDSGHALSIVIPASYTESEVDTLLANKQNTLANPSSGINLLTGTTIKSLSFAGGLTTSEQNNVLTITAPTLQAAGSQGESLVSSAGAIKRLELSNANGSTISSDASVVTLNLASYQTAAQVTNS